MFRAILLATLCLSPGLVSAQDATPSTLLPDIDPQDIEIRGDFTIRFPGIMRQPILGFNPRPRVFQIDPNRMPFIESREQVVASLPISDLERPAPPQFSRYTKPERFHFWSTTGIGNYMAPEADVYMHVPIARRTLLSGNFHNFSSGSYLDDDNQTSSFRNMNGGLNLTHYTRKSGRLELGATGRSDRNHFSQSQFSLPSNAVGLLIPLTPDNNITNIGVQAGYRWNKNALSFWDVRLEASRFSASVGQPERILPDLSVGMGYEVEQTRFAGSIRRDFAFATPQKSGMVSAQVSHGAFALDREDGQQWLIADLGGSYRTRLLYNLKTELGVRAYYGSYFGSDKSESDLITVLPQFKAMYVLTPEFSIEAEVSGFMYNQGFDGLSLVNRRLYVYQEPENEHGVRFITRASYTVFEGLRVHTDVAFTRYGNYGYYSVMPGARPYMTFGYEKGVNEIRWQAGAWYDLMPAKWNVFGTLYAQSVNDDQGNVLPFHENVGVSAGSAYSFTSRSRMQAWVDYKGRRDTGGFGPDAKGYLQAGAKFDIWASRDIGAYLKITNLFNQSYSEWVGYNELPTQVFGGIMLKF